MGHTRLGSVPTTRKWGELVSYIAGTAVGGVPAEGGLAENVEIISARALDAASTGLNTAMQDTGLRYSFYLLTQLVLSARTDEWQEALLNLGIEVSEEATIFSLIANVQYNIDDYLRERRAASDSGGPNEKYWYDRLGRVREVSQGYGAPDSKIIRYEYDGMGRRTKLVYPDSSHITYHYDELSRLTDIKDQGGSVLATYTYDELSRRKKVEYYNETTADYDYVDRVGGPADVGNMLENLTNNFSSSATKIFDYTYDDVGNCETMIVDSTDTHYYSYDTVYQLKTVDYPVGDDVTYSYDSLGNRTCVVKGGTTYYTLNGEGLNQYGTVGGNSYSYDDNGNLISGINVQHVYELDYDYENRLTEARIDSQTVGTYSYDFAGRRITKTADSTTTKYYYDGGQVIAEYEGSTLVRKFIYGPGIDEPICMIDVEDENAKYYYHYDALGSVVALSNSSGNIVETYSYDVFGEPSSTGSVGNPYFFTGRRLDAETGLYYYRARYYSKVLGRFLQTDPIGYYDSMNLYTYVGNNPTNWIDPWGLCKDVLVKLTGSDLQEAMSDFYNKHLKGETILSFSPVDWVNADTKYHFMNQTFVFDGRTYNQSQVNYIGIGMALRHLGYPPIYTTVFPHVWNRLLPDGHWATPGEIKFTKYGYYNYKKVVGKRWYEYPWPW